MTRNDWILWPCQTCARIAGVRLREDDTTFDIFHNIDCDRCADQVHAVCVAIDDGLNEEALAEEALLSSDTACHLDQEAAR